MSESIQHAIIERQKQRNEIFKQIRQNYTLDESANEILKLSVNDLMQKLQSRHLNATEALRAYMGKAMTVQDKYNCITEFVPFAMVRLFASYISLHIQ